MNKEQIIALVNKYTEKVQQKYPEFRKPNVAFDVTGKCAGQARYLKHEVSFNLILARDNSEEFENTVSHEIAHLLTKVLYPNAKQAHGPEFKRVHRWMGGTGNTYHSYDVSGVAKKRKTTTYVYTCGCTEHTVTSIRHNKMKAGALYKCNACKNRINPVMVNGSIKVTTS